MPSSTATDVLRMELPADRFAAAAVRRAVSELSSAGEEPPRAALVASELLTSLVTRSTDDGAGESLTVRATYRKGRLRISILAPGPVKLGGAGFKALEDLSARVATEAVAQGTRVWAEL